MPGTRGRTMGEDVDHDGTMLLTSVPPCHIHLHICAPLLVFSRQINRSRVERLTGNYLQK